MTDGMTRKTASPSPAGGSKKVTISLRPADLEAMTRYANRHHGGNLSGACAELVANAVRLEAMDRLVEELPPPTAQGQARLEAEISAPLKPPPPRRARRAKAA